MSKIGSIVGGVAKVAKTLVGGPIVELADEAIDMIRGSSIPEAERAQHIERLEELKHRKLEVVEATHVAEVQASVRAYEADAKSQDKYQSRARPTALYILYFAVVAELFGIRAMLLSSVLPADQFEYSMGETTSMMRVAIPLLVGIGGYYVHRRSEEKMQGKD